MIDDPVSRFLIVIISAGTGRSQERSDMLNGSKRHDSSADIGRCPSRLLDLHDYLYNLLLRGRR